jgi:hypothetical protein
MWFQVHYPPLIGVLPIVRSRYWCAIGRQRVLSLARWTSRIQTYFHVLGLTQVPGRRAGSFRVRDCHPLWWTFQFSSARNDLCNSCAFKPAWSYNPARTSPGGLGYLPVRSPLLRQSLLLSFPGGSEMFQFPPFATHAYGFSVRLFGNPGIDARLTAPPGLSQFSTPFIAFWRQDIPHMPLVA